MSEMLKKPYKITLWEDRNKIIYDNQDNVQNEFLEEVCIATIGSDTMDTPIRAFNPVLTEELNGSKTFTFTIYSRYWDDEKEVFKDNPFTKLLVNERKVKLKYDDKWYDFVIKQVQENSENYTYTYTCKDLFVNELGKTGYAVELDTELQNNMGTITELAETILDGTDWQVDKANTDKLIQKNKESLFTYVVPQDLSNVTYYLSGESYTTTIAADQVILVFNSSQANHENPVQFLYKPGYVASSDGSSVDQAIADFYKTDDYGFVKDCDNLSAILPNNWWLEVYPINMFGEKMLRKQKTKFFPQIGEVCGEYTKSVQTESYEVVMAQEGDNPSANQWYELIDENYTLTQDTEIGYVDPPINKVYKTYYNKITYNTEDLYYAYTELEYASVTEIQSMISNGCGFISTNAWIPVGDNSRVMLSSTSHLENQTTVYDCALNLQGTVYNTGFYDNRASLSPNGFTRGEKYVLMVKGSGTLQPTSYLKLVGAAGYTSIEQFLVFKDALPNVLPVDENQQTRYTDYDFYTATCNTSITYSNLLKNYSDMQFYLSFSGDLNDCKIFKYRLDSEGKLIIPDLQDTADSIIRTRYNFFLEDQIPEQAVWTKDDLKIVDSMLSTDGSLSNYVPVMVDGCEKVTSITGSKSNRFNLIQSLCEAFECWAKFTIDHDEIGRTIYEYMAVPSNEFLVGKRYYQKLSGTSENYSDDNNFEIYTGTSYPQSGSLYKKVYHKKVCFKEYIGDDNPVGFRYGINLKSIQRNVVSDQIASKVIVQPNTNEFAPNGSCTIQQSVLNPTGENALYNFQYFINHNLLDGKALSDDLYGINGGLGFFSEMRKYNDSLQPYIDQLTEIDKTLYTLQSRQAVYDAMMTEAERLLNETRGELTGAGYSNKTPGQGSKSEPEYIKTLRNRIKTYEGTITYYTDLKERNETLLSAYTDKYNGATEELKNIRKQKDQLNYDFENKYYRFIQEGTWNSNDYYDPELYYQAASMVLYTSSFPQVSYTINVLEISQIEGYEPYKFKIADKTYIEDTEFFGYDRQGRPYKEEIVISQVKYNLDDPSQNTITVRNYKTQFQDLFQRMAATSQSLQYHEGEYQRAASAINDDGTINSALMQNTLEANALVIQNAKNQSVTWDETGITISNYLNANDIVRLTSSGIVLTKDGGANWTTGITGDGINADVITAGRIDTDRIRIFNKAMQQTFEWNDKGINAYMTGGVYYYIDDNSETQNVNLNSTDVNYGQFVRFDKYGLYGYKGGYPAWDPDAPDNPSNPSEGVRGVDKAIRDSIFSLTWKGLNINVPYDSNSHDSVITVMGPNNQPTFAVTPDGNLTLSGNITWSDTSTPIKVLYARTALATPINAYSSYSSSAPNAWHQTFEAGYDEYASYSYTGGTRNSWTAAVKIVAEDGSVDVKKLYSEVALETPNLTYNDYTSTDTSGTYSLSQPTNYNYGWYENGDVKNSCRVYQSDNKGIASSNAVAKITFSGYTEFKIYIRSYAEGNYDYTIASTIDAGAVPTAYNSTYNSESIVKAHTRGNQQSATYTEVTYNSTDGVTTGTHFIYIVFRKDNATNSNDDSGYFYIATAEGQKVWHKTYNSTKDKYVSYSYDGGNTWTQSNAITVDEDTVYNALNTDDSRLGLFYDSTKGLCINASYIKTGTLDASQITVTNLNASSIKAETLTVDRIRDSSGQYSIATSGLITGGYLNLNGYSYSDNFKISNNGTAILYSPKIYGQKIVVKIPNANGDIPPDPSVGVEPYGFGIQAWYDSSNNSSGEFWAISAVPEGGIPAVYMTAAGSYFTISKCSLFSVRANTSIYGTLEAYGGIIGNITVQTPKTYNSVGIPSAYYTNKYIISTDGTGTDTGKYLWLGSMTYGGTGLAIDINNGTLNFKNSSGWHDLLSGSGGSSTAVFG